MLTMIVILGLAAVVVLVTAIASIGALLLRPLNKPSLGSAADAAEMRRKRALSQPGSRQRVNRRPHQPAGPPKALPSPGKRPASQRIRATPPHEPVRVIIKRPEKQLDFATAAPKENFAVWCECPHCGKYDSHHLRVPVRPAPPQPEPADDDSAESKQTSWWDSLLRVFSDDDPAPVGDSSKSTEPEKSDTPWWDVTTWFADSKSAQTNSEPEPEPTNDHEAATAVRICTQCDHRWAQL